MVESKEKVEDKDFEHLKSEATVMNNLANDEIVSLSVPVSK